MLAVVQIRALKPRERPFKGADGDGLYLLVQPSGALLWRFRYKVFGVERKLSLGRFPQVTLQQARRKRDEARSEQLGGFDPAAVRHANAARPGGQDGVWSVPVARLPARG